jgi:hypothetical protein
MLAPMVAGAFFEWVYANVYLQSILFVIKKNFMFDVNLILKQNA